MKLPFTPCENKGMPFSGLTLLFIAFTIAFAMPVQADTTYTYSGNPFTDFNGPSAFACPGIGVSTCRISGSFTVAQPLGADLFDDFVAPTIWVFFGGNGEWTDVTSTGSFLISTDSGGNIANWSFSLDNQTSNTRTGAPIDDILFSNNGEDFELLHFLNGALTVEASNAGVPGVWTATTAGEGGGGSGMSNVPEPPSLVLLAASFLVSAVAAGVRLLRA